MDRIDHQIVHCLQRHGRAPFKLIADVLDVSEQTVARRYRGLHAAGALRVIVLPDPRAVGAQWWFVRLQCRPGSTDALAEAIAARDDVSWVTVNAGGGELVCATRSDPEAEDGSVLLHRLPRSNQVLNFNAYGVLHMHTGGDAEWFAFDDPLTAAQVTQLVGDGVPDRGLQSPSRGLLQPTDAALLAELARDGRAGVVSLARATGWPQSRVSARLEELLGTGAVYVDVDMVPQLFGFHTLAYLWLTVAPAELEASGRALSLHPETSFVAAVTGAANLMASVTCRDADELYRYVTTKVGALPAVRQVEIALVLRRLKQAGTRIRDGRLEL